MFLLSSIPLKIRSSDIDFYHFIILYFLKQLNLKYKDWALANKAIGKGYFNPPESWYPCTNNKPIDFMLKD